MRMDDPPLRIDVAGLGKRYGTRAVVSGVSMTIAAGEIVALVGGNGGGKTTTLRMLAGLLKPDAGSGTVMGCDIRKNGAAARGAIGYMTQSVALYRELDVLTNLRFRAAIHRLADAASAIDDAIATYGLCDYATTRIDRLSGGWARRAQFAATMLHRPPLLLLDEPTAGLDAVTRRDLWGWLDALADEGHSIVISTHDLAEAERCPRIILYEAGVATGPITPADLRVRASAATLEAAIVARATCG